MLAIRPVVWCVITKERNKGRKYQTKGKKRWTDQTRRTWKQYWACKGPHQWYPVHYCQWKTTTYSLPDSDHLFMYFPLHIPEALSFLTLFSLYLEHFGTLSFFANATRYKQVQKVRGGNPPVLTPRGECKMCAFPQLGESSLRHYCVQPHLLLCCWAAHNTSHVNTFWVWV